MITAFVALAAIAMIFASGALLVDFVVDGVPISGCLSLGLLAFGLFGIYALILGK